MISQTGSARLDIGRTWDGQLLAASEKAAITLKIEPDAIHLDIDAPFHDDPAPSTSPGSVDGLWNYEVVELFIAGPPQLDGRIPYLEVELGPHSHYLVLQLSDVRQVAVQGLPLDYSAEIDQTAGRWRGKAVVPNSYLPPPPHCVNAYAIHGVGNARRYLAWQPVPGAQPDFHQPRCFAPLVDPIADSAG